MPRQKLTNKDEFAILTGVYSRIPAQYLAESLGVSAKTVRERAEKLQGTEKQKAFLAYQTSYSEYGQQLYDYLFEESGKLPKMPDKSATGIDRVMQEFDLTKKEIRDTERKIQDLAEKCLLEYKDFRKTA